MIAPRLRIVGMRSRLAGPFELELAAGEAIAITGASGSGKSLFLRMLADLDPNEGDVFLDGTPRQSIPAPAWRRQVAYVAAESGWWDEMVAPHFTDLAAARTLAARLGLRAELFDGPVLRLSTGEKQRLSLIRSLLLASPVLLLDEPTGARDEASVEMVEAVLLERIAGGTTLVAVTHNPAQGARLGRRHFIMADRKLRAA